MCPGRHFDELKKPELKALAQYLELEVEHAMLKQVIKNILIDLLVDDDLLDQFHLEEKVEVQDESDSAVKLKQLEIQKEMEMTKFQLEQERLKMEEKERQEEIQMQQKELDAKLQMEQKEREDRLQMEKEIKLKEIEAKVQMEKDKLEKHGSSTSSSQFEPPRILD